MFEIKVCNIFHCFTDICLPVKKRHLTSIIQTLQLHLLIETPQSIELLKFLYQDGALLKAGTEKIIRW